MIDISSFSENRPILGSNRQSSVILCSNRGRQVLRFTTTRRLHKGDTFAHRPERCMPLKVSHRRHRLKSCKENKEWAYHQWNHILITNESRFSVTSDS
ncbi:transposable element Tcb2 transposase [Trichonephila clavipes]|nr:transposable element Tcb2 transposase [Trichonephila clavipes]